MATSSSNRDRTIWTLVLVAVVAFLAWKLWPALKKALESIGGGSGGSGGAGGVGGATNPYPFQEPQQGGGGSGGGLSFGPGSGAGGGSSSGSDLGIWSAFDNWLQVVLSTGQDNADALNVDDTIASNGTDELAALDNSGLATTPYQLFDVNETATDQPSDAYDTSGFGYDYGGDGTDVNDYNPSDYTDTVSMDAGSIPGFADDYNNGSDSTGDAGGFFGGY